MGLHVAQMTSRDDIRACFDAVTTEPAKIMGLEGYGIAVGNNADFVVLQARDTIEAVRLRANRLYVIRRGNIIAETPLQQTCLHLSERPETVRGDDYAPGK
jgi:cytosine deaminase